MTDFAVIPVIDLRRGQVVRARAGERHSYAPIATPLAKGSTPGAVAAGLAASLPAARILYVADLDAIMEGAAPDRGALEAIAAAWPGVTLWVDAGFRREEAVARFLDAGLGRPVIGSESQADADLVRALGPRAILSLDSRGDGSLGPPELHADPGLWPEAVIVMTLARVGAGTGPDLAALSALRARASLRAPSTRFYAAGGVRGPEDLGALRAAGAAGALVASALHDGRITAADA